MISEPISMQDLQDIDKDETTFWENVAQSRWGRYISEIEKRAILKAHSVSGRPNEAVEIGCGGYVGDAFCKPAELLKDKKATAALKDAVTSRGLTISAAISNVLNRDPPFTNKNIGIGFGYDERYTDPIGRAYSLRISYDFQRQK